MMRRNNPPQAKRRPQPKKASAPPRRAPQRAHPKRQDTSNTRHLLSPLTTQLVPSLAFQGEAFPYTGLVRHEVNAPITNKVIFFATNVGTSATCLMELRWDANGAGTTLVGVKNVFTIPTLINADDTGGPTSMRPMKAGMTIVNRTQLLSRGGPVYTLNLNSRIRAAKPPSTMTVADAEALLSTLIAHPDCHAMDAVDFGKPRHMYSHVVDDPAYNNFEENRGAITVDEFFKHIAIVDAGQVYDRPMSTMVFIIDKPTAVQSFQITARASFYTRWPLDTVPGQSNKAIPTTSHAKHNATHSSASQHSKGTPSFVSDVESAAKRFGKDAETVAADMGRNMYRRGKMGALLRNA